MISLVVSDRVYIKLWGIFMPRKKATKKATKRIPWSKADNRALKDHSKARTPVVKIAKDMKRTVGALRRQANKLGFGLGHQR
jgi:hypothetical protein